MFYELDNADLSSKFKISRKRLDSIRSISSSKEEGGEAKTAGTEPRRESDPELERRKSLRAATASPTS